MTARSIAPSNKSADEQILREAVNDLIAGNNKAVRGDDLISSGIFEYDPAGRLRIGKVVQNLKTELLGTNVVINGITTGLQEIQSTFEMTNKGLLAQTREITELKTHVEILRKRGDQIDSRIVADANANRELLSRVTANDNMIEVLARDQVKLQAQLAIGEGSLSFMGNEVIANAEATSTLEAKITATDEMVEAMAQQITELNASINVLPRIFLQTNEPDPADQGPFNVGDMWLQSDDGNKVHVWDGSTWSESVDLQGATVYAQTTAPAGAGLRIGDVWFDMSDNNRMHRWDGTQWVDMTNPIIDATAAATQQLRADVTLIQGQVTTNAQAITNLNTQIAGKADASTVTALGARVTATENSITTANQAITTLQSQIGDKADASAVQLLTTRMTAAEGLITSQGEFAVNLSNSVQNIGGDNLLGNSGFDNSNLTGWSTGGNSGVTRSFVDSALPNSTKALRIAMVNMATGYSEIISNSSIQQLRVEGGKKLTMSAYVRGNGAVRVFLQIRWYDAAGATLGYSGSPDTADFKTTEGWSRKKFVFNAPATAVSANAYIRVYAANLPDQWAEIDNIQVQVGEVATGYTPSANEITSNITAGATATQQLTTRVTAAEGNISSLSTSVVDLTSTLSVTAGQGSNLITNGSFDSGLIGWRLTGPGTGYNATEGRGGGGCWKGGPASDGTIARGAISSVGGVDRISVTPGRSYRISCWYKTDADFNGSVSNTKLRIGNATGGLIRSLDFSASLVWRKLETVLDLANDSTTTSLVVQVTRNGTLGNVWADDIWVEDVTDIAAANGLISANSTALQLLTTRVTAAEGAITSTSTSVTQLQSSIQNIGGDNLLPNSSYESRPSDTAAPTGWVVEGTIPGGITLSYIDSPLSGGGKAFRLAGTTTAANQYLGLAGSNVFTDKTKAQPNKTYVLTSNIRAIAGANVQMFMQFVNAANSVVATITLPVVPTTGEWQRLVLTGSTAFVSAVAVRVFVGRMIVPVAGTAAWIELDNAMLQEGSVATQWVPGSVDGITATAANAAATQQLTTRVTSVEGQVSAQATSITNLSSSLTITNNNVTTAQGTANAAQTAAQAASDAAGAKGKVLYGTAAPAVADRLPQNLWIDTTGNANTPKRWNGSTWVPVTDKVATDAAAAAAAAAALAATKADASIVSAMSTKVDNIDGRVTAQAGSITTLQAQIGGKAEASVVQSMDVRVKNQGAGGNLITNSTFPFWERNGWGWFNAIGFGELGNPSGNTDFLPYGTETAIGSNRPGTTGSNPDFYYGTEYRISIQQGKNYCASAYFNTHRCEARIGIDWFNAAGQLITSGYSAWSGVSGIGRDDLRSYPRPFVIGGPPAGAVQVRIVINLRVLGADPYFWMIRPMFCEVVDGATQPPPWSAGGTEAFAQWGVTVNANGVIGGVQLASNGQKSKFKIDVDQFEITKPGGGERTEFSNGNWRVYDNLGRLVVAWGVNI